MSETTRVLNVRPNVEVADMDRAVSFSERSLGLRVRSRAAEFGLALLGTEGGAEIALQQVSEPAARSCYVNVAGVDELHRRCTAAGVAIDAPLTTQPWGMRDFVVRDPDGNMIAIGERVAGG